MSYKKCRDCGNEAHLYTCFFCAKQICCFCHYLKGSEGEIVKCCYACSHNGDKTEQALREARKEKQRETERLAKASIVISRLYGL